VGQTGNEGGSVEITTDLLAEYDLTPEQFASLVAAQRANAARDAENEGGS
jgi:hypothetical protein